MSNLPVPGEGEFGLFDRVKRLNEHGVEYWTARDIMPLLDYTEWRNFSHAIQKVRTSCQQSGNNPDDHFVDVNNLITTGKGGAAEDSGC